MSRFGAEHFFTVEGPLSSALIVMLREAEISKILKGKRTWGGKEARGPEISPHTLTCACTHSLVFTFMKEDVFPFISLF